MADDENRGLTDDGLDPNEAAVAEEEKEPERQHDPEGNRAPYV